MAADGSGTAGWHCIVAENFNVGSGKSQYTQYRAYATSHGDENRELLFRFSEVDGLAKALRALPDLSGVAMPRLPPKITFKSVAKGRFDPDFLQQRQGLIQEFFESLATELNSRYGDVGNVFARCEPLRDFVDRCAARCAAEERAAIEAVAAQVRIEEDRDIVATQEAEYEESLQIDELRRVAEATTAEEERQKALAAAQREEQQRMEAAQKAAAEAAEREALAKDAASRRAAFEDLHPEPQGNEAQAMVKIRRHGATVQRKFPESIQVSVLFEFAAIADWGDAGVPRAFDLKTSFPARSLKEIQESTLKEAELCPSAVLQLVSEED